MSRATPLQVGGAINHPYSGDMRLAAVSPDVFRHAAADKQIAQAFHDIHAREASGRIECQSFSAVPANTIVSL